MIHIEVPTAPESTPSRALHFRLEAGPIAAGWVEGQRPPLAVLQRFGVWLGVLLNDVPKGPYVVLDIQTREPSETPRRFKPAVTWMDERVFVPPLSPPSVKVTALRT